jgi:hypothetical protein
MEQTTLDVNKGGALPPHCEIHSPSTQITGLQILRRQTFDTLFRLSVRFR